MKKMFLWHKYFKQPSTGRRSNPSKWCLLAFIVLCMAVLVWDVSSSDFIGPQPVTSAVPAQSDVDAVSAGISDNNNDSDSQDKENAEQAAEEVFAAYRLDREQSRAEELDLLQEVIDDVNSSAEAKQQAEQRRLQLAADVQAESQAEQMLDAEGFGKTVVLKGVDRATVICALELDAITATRIAEIVSSACLVNFENVVIVNRCTI